MEATTAKACSRCMIVKPVEDFSRDRTRADGLARRCRQCAVAVNRGAYERRQLAAGLTAGPASPRTGRQRAEPGHKICGSCREQRPTWLFHHAANRADGLSGYCRTCDAERSARKAEARADVKLARGPKPAPAPKPQAANARHGRRPTAAPRTPEAAAKLAAKAAERAEKAVAREAAAKVIMAAVADRAAELAVAWEARRRATPSAADQARMLSLLAAAEADKAKAILPA